MKPYTAKAIVTKLMLGDVVKLRQNRFHGIAKNTWDAICDVLFTDYAATSVNVNYTKYLDKTLANFTVMQNDKKILVTTAILY